VGVRGLPLAKSSGDSPHLGLVVFVSFDELSWESKAFANRNLEGRDAIVVVDEIGWNAVFVVVEILIFASFQGSLQAVLGVVNASTHSCAVSFPGEFAKLDGGDKTGDDFPKTFGGDFVVSGQSGEDSVRG